MFVNPYTFVPLPDTGPDRCAPHGHRGDPDLLSAQLDVTITAQAPLLVRGFGTDGTPALPMKPNPDGSGEVAMIPGSGLHGAVRSLHETLTESCLRVFDDGFVPCYRQQADMRQIARLRLAVVREAGPVSADGRQAPPAVQLCAEVGDARRHRLHQNELAERHAAAGLRSGDRLDLVVPRDDKQRLQITEWHDKGAWVVFLSDAGAREPKHPYRAAVRELTDRHEKIPDDAWTTFLDVVETADDMRTERLKEHPEKERWIEVVHTYEPKDGVAAELRVGMRSLVRRTVEEGQPLWVRLDEHDQITHVQMAQIWRDRGARSAGERVGNFAPCTDDKNLCPSCRLFGSADVTGAADGATAQRSYRGHVRFSDAIATGPVTPKKVQLPPMGAPKPGAGQFYLENPPEIIGNADKDVPLRQWGSRADAGEEPRRIRGRKFYWHTVPPVPQLPARGVARREHTNTKMTADAVLFPAGTTFRARITAVDVDREQLGALLAALDPTTVLGRNDLLVHLGGGRPLGYGSCTVTVDDSSRVWITGARYSTMSTPPDLLGQSRNAFAKTRSHYGATWTALTRALSRGIVARQTVAYPPGELVGEEDVFDFWKQSAGKELEPRGDGTRCGHPLTVLPPGSNRDQTMKGVRKAASVSLPTQALPASEAREPRGGKR